jgi:hypothetical protein
MSVSHLPGSRSTGRRVPVLRPRPVSAPMRWPSSRNWGMPPQMSNGWSSEALSASSSGFAETGPSEANSGSQAAGRGFLEWVSEQLAPDRPFTWTKNRHSEGQVDVWSPSRAHGIAPVSRPNRKLRVPEAWGARSNLVCYFRRYPVCCKQSYRGYGKMLGYAARLVCNPGPVSGLQRVIRWRLSFEVPCYSHPALPILKRGGRGDLARCLRCAPLV